MTKTFETNEYGDVTVRNAMLEEEDGTTLSDGIELRGDGIDLDIFGWYSIEDMEPTDVEKLIDNNR